jgi:hypothetical protein
MGSLYIPGTDWLIVAPMVTGPQIWGAGGEIAFYESGDSGKTWKETRQITCKSPRNHSYVRRPQHARDPFMYFWADGDAHQFSISNLYFGDSKGEIWQMPYFFPGETVKPTKITLKND